MVVQEIRHQETAETLVVVVMVLLLQLAVHQLLTQVVEAVLYMTLVQMCFLLVVVA
jgi:hypothetical protein